MAKDPRAEFIQKSQGMTNRQDEGGVELEEENVLERQDGEEPRDFFIRQSHELREDAPTRKIKSPPKTYGNTREDFVNKSQRYARGVLQPGQALHAGGEVV